MLPDRTIKHQTVVEQIRTRVDLLARLRTIPSPGLSGVETASNPVFKTGF
jgi:hypothetical protein